MRHLLRDTNDLKAAVIDTINKIGALDDQRGDSEDI